MAGQLTIDTLKASSGVLATQNGMTGIAKAWVQFSYSTGSMVVSTSFNVSSVTRSATGQYTVNFSTAMSSANYVPAINCSSIDLNAIACAQTNQTSSALGVLVGSAGPSSYVDNKPSVYVTVFSS